MSLARLAKFDQEPRLIDWAQSPWGRGVLCAVFALILAHISPSLTAAVGWVHLMMAATLCAWAGPYRRQMLALTTLVILCLYPDWFPSAWLQGLARREGLLQVVDVVTTRHAMTAVVISLAVLLIYCRQRYPRAWPSRWPLLCLFALYFGLILLANSGALPGYPRFLVYAFVWALGAYFWYLAYALREATRSGPLWYRLGTFHPFFAGGILPVGLGMANLRSLEAKDSRDLAICQLKGVKLLLDCLLLFYLQLQFSKMHSAFQVPFFGELLPQHLAGQALHSRAVCWASLVAAFFELIVAASLAGNALVACARLAGFRLLQHTYKPLQARSIADFWNRISFYFKQVMVDFFFYPCFVACFKGSPRLRLFFAVFWAAGVGNLLFHFRQAIGLVARLGLLQTLQGMQSYAFYCLILCTGITLSQSTSQGGPTRPSLTRRIWILGKIVIFYAVLQIFDVLYSEHSLIERLAFLGYLVGL